MPEFVKGQRVHVSYEAEYSHQDSGDGWHHVQAGQYWPLVPPEATIEAIDPPQPEEPKAFGALVEVDGQRYTRADDDDEPWRGAAPQYGWHSWYDLAEKGPVKVLFDPDVQDDGPDPKALPETLVDGAGDTWYLKDNGKYRLYEDEPHGTWPLEYIREYYGISSQV